MSPGPRRRFALSDEHFPNEEELAAAFEQAGYGFVSLGEAVQREHYYDDDAGRLEQRGLVLCRRSDGSELRASLGRSGEDGGLSFPASGQGWPAALERRLRELSDAASLRPRLELSLRERHYRFSRPAASGELVLVRVEARYPGSSQSVQFQELELSLPSDDADPSGSLMRALALMTLVADPAPRLQRVRMLLSLGAGLHG